MKRQDFDIRGTTLVRYLGRDETVIVPDGITELDTGAFRLNEHIVQVVLPDTVKFIGNRAFEECKNLQSVNIPSKVTVIPHGTFSGCKKLKKITLPEGLNEIWIHAFCGCESLETVNIPLNITAIASTAFSDTPFLENQKDGFFIAGDDVLFAYSGNEKRIVIPHGVKKVFYSAFYEKEPEFIHIPETVTEITTSAFGDCHHIKEFSVDENNPDYCSIDGSLYSKDRKTLFCYATKEPKKVFRVPDFVENINDDAFRYTDPPETIIIPKSVNMEYGLKLNSPSKIVFEGRLNDYTVSSEYPALYCIVKCLDVPCRKNLEKIADYRYSIPIAITLFRENPDNFETLGIRRFLDSFIHKFRYEYHNFTLSSDSIIEILLQIINAEILNEKRFNRIFETVLEKMETENELAVLITPLLEYKNRHFGYGSPEEHFKL